MTRPCSTFAVEFEAMITRLQWSGRQVWSGDWNMEPADAWIATLGAMIDVVFIGCDAESTRWEGRRHIDYHLSNDTSITSKALAHRVSDHKVIQATLQLRTSNSHEHRFKKGPKFHLPPWLDVRHWREIIQEAFNIEQACGWKTAKQHMDVEDVKYDVNEDLDEEMVNFYWQWTMMQWLTVFKTAYFLALLAIPEHYDDVEEIKTVEKLANKVAVERLRIEKHQMDFKPLARISMRRRKLRRKIAKVGELLKHVRAGRYTVQTERLCWKLICMNRRMNST